MRRRGEALTTPKIPKSCLEKLRAGKQPPPWRCKPHLRRNRTLYGAAIEITELAQTIHRNPNLVPVERHGDRPEISACHDAPANWSKSGRR